MDGSPPSDDDDPIARVNRRRLLHLSGLGTAGLLAGCMGDDDGDDETTTEERTDTTDDTPTDTTTTGQDTGSEPEDLAYIDQDGPRDLLQIAGSGTGFGGDGDQGHYYYGEVSGDFDVAVHATSLEGVSDGQNAGLMIREALDPAAPMVNLRRRDDGEALADNGPARVAWRSATDETGQLADVPDAEWLRLKRAGDTLEIYGSMTNENWTLFETFAIPDDVELSEDVLVGPAVTRGSDGVEWEAAATVTGTFKDLTGVDPSENVDLGEPEYSGDLTVREDVAHVTTLEPDTNPDEGTMTLNASLYLPEGHSEADCSFEYRRYDESEWTATEPETLSSRGTTAVTVDASPRRIYLLRAVADVPDAPDVQGATPTRGVTAFRSSSAGGDRSGADEDLSPGVSQFGPGDGFAEPAPWLDDDTPIIKITEPTYEALAEAFRTPCERLIVFETSGTVDLKEQELTISKNDCYVAGQTAPSPGITLVRGMLDVSADNCVVQHIRSRPGDAGRESSWGPDAINVHDESENNVVDHCTGTWGLDENVSTGYGSRNVTISNCLIGEALANSIHPEGEHSAGTLIADYSKNVALMGNVWACNIDRNPRLKDGTETVLANNLAYHYDTAVWISTEALATIESNVFLGATTDEPTILSRDGHTPRTYVANNSADSEVAMTGEDLQLIDERPLWPDGLETVSADRVETHNLANAGARPADRTEHDERLVQLIADREGTFIDSQEEVGGYPDLPENTHSLSVPESGLRAWLREWSARVENTS